MFDAFYHDPQADKLLEEAAMNRQPSWDGYIADEPMSLGPEVFHVLQQVIIIDSSSYQTIEGVFLEYIPNSKIAVSLIKTLHLSAHCIA